MMVSFSTVKNNNGSESNMNSINNKSKTDNTTNNTLNSRILVAYFSRADENYSVENIEKGNTEIVAEMFQSELDSDIYKIETTYSYPADYTECIEVAKSEQATSKRPKLKNKLDSISNYDYIYLGYPIWWSDMPMVVYTFLESFNFKDKKIVPFCTHEGSGLTSTVNNIKDTCKEATVLKGLAIIGSKAQNNREETRKIVKEFISNVE